MSRFTNLDKQIARVIDPAYKYIARGYNDTLYIFANCPEKKGLRWDSQGAVNRISFIRAFKGIKWEDEEPVLISDIYKDDDIVKEQQPETGNEVITLYDFIQFISQMSMNEWCEPELTIMGFDHDGEEAFEYTIYADQKWNFDDYIEQLKKTGAVKYIDYPAKWFVVSDRDDCDRCICNFAFNIME